MSRIRAWLAVGLAPALYAGTAAAQVPGVPLPLPQNARVSPRPLVTASLESGLYRLASTWMVPIALRGALDYRAFALSAGGAALRSTDAAQPDGIGFGVGASLRLWRPGTAYLTPGGRVLVGATYSRFATDGGPTVWRLDLPLAIAFSHRLPPPRVAILPWLAPRVSPSLRHDGGVNDWRLLVGGSFGVELAKTLCTPGARCLTGYGLRLGLELMGDVGGGPLEGGVSLGALWKFF